MNTRLLPVISMGLLALSSYGQSDKKVVGYLPTYRFDNLPDLELEHCTHVNIAFVNPDMQGNFTADGADIDPVVEAIHQAGAEAFISLAGGYLAPPVDSAWDFWLQPAHRPQLIDNIVTYVQDHNIDGVDIDIEWQYVDAYYSPFVIELKAALEPYGVPLTAALPGSYRYPQVSDDALDAFDWINMMVYDLTGPWDPSNPGQHSPFWWAEDCIDYWIAQGVPPGKLTLGMPFYGYNFALNPVGSFTFRFIVNLDTDYAYLDNVDQRWYNGIPTIQAKTQLAIERYLDGVMIWELGQDVLAGNLKQYSLLRAIDVVLNPPVDAPELAVSTLNMYPNPVQDWLYVPGAAEVRISDLNGRQWFSGTQQVIDTGLLPAGVYVVQAQVGERLVSGRLVKA